MVRGLVSDIRHLGNRMALLASEVLEFKPGRRSDNQDRAAHSEPHGQASGSGVEPAEQIEYRQKKGDTD